MAEAQSKQKETTNTGTENTGFNNQSDSMNTKTGAGSTQGQTGESLGLDKESVKEVYSKAKETTKETAKQAYSQVAEKATSQIEEQKAGLAQGLHGIADTVRQTSENLREAGQETPIANFTAKYGESLAQQIDGVSNYLNKKELSEMVNDVEHYARRNPAVFIGAAFGVGFLLARFLKSSGSGKSSAQLTSGSSQTSSNRLTGQTSARSTGSKTTGSETNINAGSTGTTGGTTSTV